MNVLLVEPDTKLANTYGAALGKAGFIVSLTAHAQDAIHAADSVRPDIVVLELQLSGHSGIEFLYEFRSYAEWQDIPVILLTMVPESTLGLTKVGMRQLGITQYLYKPATSLTQLIEAVERTS
jgi:DNA-binding response OmpR family regulator